MFAFARENDFEGIVAKHKFGPYLEDAVQWFKIRNRGIRSGRVGRSFFERERDVDADIFLWESCVSACENV